ncbi:MAG: hypothetical protein F6J97_22600, partial [Leptolyngbya sp. SIO4C1]|nr:hypothetical protein [Leptolyngbya sp. SIO4C1]
ISVAIDLSTFRVSDRPEQRTLADLISTVSELSTAISRVEKKMDKNFNPFISSDALRRYTSATDQAIDLSIIIKVIELVIRNLRSKKSNEDKEKYLANLEEEVKRLERSSKFSSEEIGFVYHDLLRRRDKLSSE